MGFLRPQGVLLGTVGQSGAPVCAWRQSDVAHAGSKNEVCDLMFSSVFIDILLPGRGFSQENIEFSFLVF